MIWQGFLWKVSFKKVLWFSQGFLWIILLLCSAYIEYWSHNITCYNGICRIEGSMPTFSMWKWQLTTELFPTDMFAKKTCDKFAKICRRTYPCISQLVATLSTLLNSNFTIHSGIQNNICHIIRHTWLLLVWKWVLTLQKIS